jgi:dephospho-CoA kinase
MEPLFDATIAVVAPDELRERRADERGHQALESRTERQLDQAEKARRADHVVDNDGDLAQLESRLSHVLATIEA